MFSSLLRLFLLFHSLFGHSTAVYIYLYTHLYRCYGNVYIYLYMCIARMTNENECQAREKERSGGQENKKKHERILVLSVYVWLGVLITNYENRNSKLFDW